MKLLTIVIPTYNMEKYLDNCLQSFVNENNELFSKIEVLVVNDGSTDNSATIAKEYEERYPDRFRLIDKENGGHGSTINVGIKEATGRYFRVVDSDDWVDTGNFYVYLEKLQNLDVDIVFTPYMSVDEETGRKKKFMYNTRGLEKEKVCLISDFLKGRQIKMHTITYKTNILQKNNICLDEHCFYVDTEYVLFPLKHIQNCMLINNVVYMYRVNMSTQSCSNDGYFRHCEDHRKVSLHLLEFIISELKSDIDNSKKRYYYGFILKMLEKQYRIYLMDTPFSASNKQDIISYDKSIRRYSHKIYLKIAREKYIEELRDTQFRGYVLHKLKFYWLQQKGIYQGLDF